MGGSIFDAWLGRVVEMTVTVILVGGTVAVIYAAVGSVSARVQDPRAGEVCAVHRHWQDVVDASGHKKPSCVSDARAAGM